MSRSWWVRSGFFLTGLTALAVLVLYLSDREVSRAAGLRVHRSAADVPPGRVCLVLGCSPKLQNGLGNVYFENRLLAAAELWRQGRCSRFLLSGDNHLRGYDEPTAMKARLEELGVPESAIVLDYAGFTTLDSVARARLVFGLSEVCIVTQPEHARRALYLADAFGLRAEAFAAADIPFRYAVRAHVRESMARAKAILDVRVLDRQPHFSGPLESSF